MSEPRLDLTGKMSTEELITEIRSAFNDASGVLNACLWEGVIARQNAVLAEVRRRLTAPDGGGA